MLIAGALVGLIAVLAVKDSDKRKMAGWIGLVVAVIGVIGMFVPGTPLGNTINLGGQNAVVQQPATVVVTTTPTAPGITPGLSGECNYQPTATYSAKDKYSTTSVPGTAYYKPSGLPATTTAYTNLNKGTTYTYWVSNSTYFVRPVTISADCGNNPFTADSWAYTAATITGYDLVNHQTTTSGAYNTSMGANDLANVQVTYQGVAKKSAGPFGGVMVIEYNSSISSVTATGDQILSSNPYHVTYSVSATSHTSKQFAYSSDLDDGTGSVRTINLQVQNGASAAGDGADWKVTFIPANYYVTNDGNIELDTEKFANSDTSRTNLGEQTATFYWGA